MRVRSSLALAVAVALSGCTTSTKPPSNEVVAHEATFNCDNSPLGPADDFRPLLSGEGDAPGAWRIIDIADAVTGKHAVAQLSNDPTVGRFPILIWCWPRRPRP